MAAVPELAGSRAVAPWRQKLDAFWLWWTGQLAQMVPERLASLGGATRVPQLSFEGEEVVLVEPRLAEGAEIRAAVSLDPQRARAAVRSLLQRAGETRARARLVLGQEQALLRRATMPAATQENLAQVLAFEMDRLTPFRADEVYFDHRVIARDAPTATITVLVGVARRDLVDRHVEALRSLGVTVEGVAVREEASLGGPSLNLMPSELRGERESARERLVKRVLLVVVGLLFFAVLVYPAWRKREAWIALHPQVLKAQSEAQATDSLARELERLVGEYNFLLAKKHGTPPALAYIEEVSRLLPDNTWVQQLDLKAAGKTRELQITGETASSSKLIEILEQSTLLKNATPRGTVTRGSLPGTERFAIAAEAKVRPQPEPAPLAQLSTPIAPASAQPAPAAKPAPAKAEPPKTPLATAPATPAKVESVPLPLPLPKAPGDAKGGKTAPGK